MLWPFPGLSGGQGAWGDSGGNACPPLFLQTPGMPIPQYPYGDNPGVTLQGPQLRAPEDTWGLPSVYGVRYAWPAAPGHGNPFGSDSHPPWAGSAAPAHPPAWDTKVQPMLLQRLPDHPTVYCCYYHYHYYYYCYYYYYR